MLCNISFINIFYHRAVNIRVHFPGKTMSDINSLVPSANFGYKAVYLHRAFFYPLLIFLFIISNTSLGYSASESVNIVSTLFPSYDFSRQVGKELVNVSLLLPPGVEAHGFAPTPRDLVTISRADIFLFTGEIMEPWVADILMGVDNKKLLVVDLSKDILIASGNEPGEHHHHHHHHNNDNNSIDSHFWLDPLKAKKMVHAISNALGKVDPANQKIYQEAARDYIKNLSMLDENIRRNLSNCKIKTIISGGHLAFGHFCSRYNLNIVSAYKGFSPDAKPSPRDIISLIKTMKKLGSKTVFHEELIQPKIATIIAEETGASLKLLHGLHNTSRKERQKGETYLSLMQGNIQSLKEGLQCQ
jgi:zinc transport system substrate-binding protein